MNRKAKPNPWGLTPAQCRVLTAVVGTGCDKLASEALGLSIKTVSTYMVRARKRIGASTRLHAILAWDRWKRAQKEAST